MNFKDVNRMPVFEDDPLAVRIRDAFSSENLWKGKAIDAFRGRGVYEGILSYEEDGKKIRKEFSFQLHENSLEAYLKQVENLIHESGTEVSLDSLESVLNYSEVDKAAFAESPTPVLFLDREDVGVDWMVEELLGYMYDMGTEIQTFAVSAYYNGSFSHLVTPEVRDKSMEFYENHGEKVEDYTITMTRDRLVPAFAKLMKEAGHDRIDDIVFSVVAPGYDKNGGYYQGKVKAIYDDADNLILIQTPPLSPQIRERKEKLKAKMAALEEFEAEQYHPQTFEEAVNGIQEQSAHRKAQEEHYRKKYGNNPETLAKADEKSRKEDERIRSWRNQRSPEHWKGIALKHYNGAGIYEGSIQRGTSKIRFELIQRHDDFSSFLSHVGKLSIMDETGSHTVESGEAKLKKIGYAREYVNDWVVEADLMEEQEITISEADVIPVVMHLENQDVDLKNAQICVTLGDGYVIHMSVNGEERNDLVPDIRLKLQPLVDHLEDSLQEKMDLNGEDHADTLILLTYPGTEYKSVVMYDEENNAVILNTECME